MPGTKDINRRIKSVNNTKKITRAMEMVSAAKMRRAVEAVLKTRTYSNLSWLILLNLSAVLSQDPAYQHPLLKKRNNIKKNCIVLIASNRGLCGGFNSAIINKAHQSVVKHQANHMAETEFVVVGKKGLGVYKYYNYKIIAEFPKTDIITEVKEVYVLSKFIIDSFTEKKYDKIFIAYTDFESASKQTPRIKQILPIDINSDEEYLGITGQDTRLATNREYIKGKEGKHLKDEKFTYEYIFEPNPKEVLEELIPRLIEIQLYQAFLESNASEHSARMAAMHQATDAAAEMVNDLTLSYNKARQSNITAEIAEISAGANALNEK